LLDPIVIAPEGELDFAEVGEFQAALSRAGAAAVGIVVDLSSVSFIDSSGLSALVDLYNRLRRDNRRLGVVVPGGTAAAVLLNLAGLHTRMPIYATREAALASQVVDRI
jgi:anti-anti-sigma factor